VRLTPYARWTDADLILSFFPSQAQEISRQKGAGLQATAYWDPNEELSLIVGADGDWTRGSLREFQSLPTIGTFTQGLHYDYVVDMRVLAAYAQASWAFAQDWRLTAGLRGETVRYDYDNHAPDGDVGRFRRPADRVDEYDAVTPKLRGARAPQITDLYSLQPTQAPGAQAVETIDSIELGWRAQLGDARVELALFHMDKRDTSFRNADGVTVTGAKTRHEGVELSGSVPLGEQFDLSGWITYARHTYQFSDPVTRAGESINAGDDIDSAPRWVANLRAAWRPTAASRLELEWVHIGEYFTNADNSRSYPGHDVMNLRGDLALNDDVALTAAVRNVTNTDYAERADFAFGNDRYFPGEDRGYTLGLRVRR
jgi:outer membrane receptor protein involved in Fe transport